MSTHYYLGWFNEGFTEKIGQLLSQDIKDRKSLVMISARGHESDETVGSIECSWLEEIDVKFETYHLIDYRIEKEEAQNLIENASVIFLLGGNVDKQNKLLVDYDLKEKIRMSKAIVLGTSAGSINMSSKLMIKKSLAIENEEKVVCSGIGCNEISVLSHYDLENNMDQIQGELAPLLKEMNVYGSNKDCAIRVKHGKVDILGDVYLVSKSDIKKLDATL